MKHYAIESRSLSMKGKWIQALLNGKVDKLSLMGKKGLLFSTITLEKFISEENRHNQFILSDGTGRSIRTYSSGEQRKALLGYQMSQKPDFLVLDNPFDCLDVASVEMLKKHLVSVAEDISIVQIFKRHKDILPFISDVLIVQNESLVANYSIEEFKEKHLHREEASLNVRIPESIKPFKDVPEVLVEMKDVKVSYDNRVIVNDINWRIKQGEFWHLKGANGSGKTTLLSMIYGDNPKAFGQNLFLFGQKKGSGESVWDIKQKIGYFTPSMTELFQSNNTVEQMVISGLVDSVGLYLKPTDRQLDFAKRWLNVIDLMDEKDEAFYRLTQVKQRVVLIARAMIKHPPLLILDEPSTGLDDYSASLMVKLINKIAKESTTAIIYVSHRKEDGLTPQYTFELQKGDSGSVGFVC